MSAELAWLEAADPIALGTAVAMVGERAPDCALVISLRLAVEQIEARRQYRRDIREASWAVSGATDWRRCADSHVTHEELHRRRGYPPKDNG